MARERCCSVADLKERTTVEEFEEWAAYQQIDPSNEWRADYRAALICATMRNMWAGKGERLLTPQDILDMSMNFEPKPYKGKTPEQIDAELCAWANGLRKRAARKAVRRGA